MLARLLALVLLMGLGGCDWGQKGETGSRGATGAKGQPGEAAAAGPVGPAGPQGEQGSPSGTLRIVRVNCLTNSACAASCRSDEIITVAYCGPSRAAPIYSGERQVSCGLNADAANTPLVVVCAGLP